jgi:hypothetical protein
MNGSSSVSKAVILLAALAPLAWVRSASAAAPPKFGLARAVKVVCIKFDVAPAPRKATCQDWVDELNQQVSSWHGVVSDNRVTYQFDRAPVHAAAQRPPGDWFELPFPSGGFFINDELNDVVLPAIDGVIDFSSIDQLVLISAGPSPFGQAVENTDPGDTVLSSYPLAVGEGAERSIERPAGVWRDYRDVAIALLGEAEASDPAFVQYSSAVLFHEFGHLHGHPDRYASWVMDGSGRDYATGYSPMALQWSDQVNALSTHYLAPEQHEMGFAQAAAPLLDVPRDPLPQEFDLVYLSNSSPPAGHKSMLRLAVEGSAPGFAGFRGYTLEARQRDLSSMYGDHVLEPGVVVSWIDPRQDDSRRIKVVDDPDHPGDLWHAAFDVGDRYEDAERGVAIEVVQALPTGYRVRITYTTPSNMRPDVSITDWNANGWETPDIWIDSPLNGWNTYASADGNRDVPAVRGNPNEPAIGHRVYYRVANLGLKTAQNATIRMWYSAPGIGQTAWIPFGGSQPLGAIAPGASATGYFDGWIVPDGFANGEPHACIKLEITPGPDDLNLANNAAQENIFQFETVQNSPWHPRGRLVTVTNPSPDSKAHVLMHVAGLPPGWAVRVSPQGFALDPLKSRAVDFRVYPAGAPGRPAPGYDAGYLGKVRLFAQMDYEKNGHLRSENGGGVNAWVRLTNGTETSLSIANTFPGGATLRACVAQATGPAVAGARVAVQYWRGAAAQWLAGTAGASGCAVLDAPGLGSTGLYTARAFYVGTGVHGSSRSGTQTFVVK